MYLQYSTSAQGYIAEGIEKLGEHYGVKVATSNVRIRFHFPTMLVEMSDLELQLPDSPISLFSSDFLYLRMDLPQSFMQRKVVFSEADFYRSSVTIHLDENGRPEFPDMLSTTPDSGFESQRVSVLFRDSTFTFVNHANLTLGLRNVDLTMEANKENMQLKLRSGRSETFAEMHLTAKIKFRSDRIAGDFHIETQELDLGSWGDFFAFNKLGRGVASGAFWGVLDEGSLSSLTGKLELQDYQGSLGADEKLFGMVKADELFPLNLETEFSWTGTQNASKLQVAKLFLFSPTVQIKQGTFSLQHSRALVAESHLRFVVPDIDDKTNRYVSKIFREYFAPSSLTVAFSRNSIRAAALFHHDPVPETVSQDSALFAQLLLPPSFLATPTLTRFGITMEAEELRVSDARTFELPGHLRDFSGSLHLAPSSSGLMVLSRIDSATIAGGQLQGDFFGTFGEQEPVIHTFLEMRSVSLTAVRGLLPFKLMEPTLQDWFKESLLSGLAEHATLGLSGPLHAFPFAEGGGHFFANIQVNDGRIRYRKRLAPVTHIVGEVRFAGKKLTVDAHQARFYGLLSTKVRVEIPDLARPVVKVRLQATSDLAQMLDYLSATGGLAVGKVPRFLLEGAGSITLAVDAPLAQSVAESLRLEGMVRFADARLQLPEQDWEFDAVNGTLHFDADGPRKGQFTTRLAGQRLVVEVARQARNFEIQVRGNLSSEYLVARYLPAFQGHVSGVSHWDINVQIPAQSEKWSEQGILADLRSGLVGSTFELPAPLAKKAAEKREFTMRIIHKNTRMELQPKLRNIAAAHYVSERLPLSNTVNLSARFLQPVDVLAWSRWLPEGASSPTIVGDVRVQLSFAAVQLGSTQTGELWFGAHTDKVQRIRMNVRSDWLQGRALIPRSPDAIGHIKLDKLFLSSEMFSGPGAGTSMNSFSRLPLVKAYVKSLKFGDLELTSVATTFQVTDTGVEVSRFSADLPEARGSLDLAGDWKVQKARQKTRLQLRVKAQNFGSLLSKKEQNTALEKGAGYFHVELAWPGSPGDFSLEKAVGSANVELRKGTLKQVDPSISKLFGLLNLSVLLRRLSLDFSDLLEKGLPFDKLSGNFTFRDRKMDTRQLLVNSPTMQIKMEGQTDIGEELYDLNIEVVPNLSGSLPVAAALVGGPLVGGLVFLGEKIVRLGKKLDEVLILHYRLEGKWSEPKIKFVKAPIMKKLNILNILKIR